jgi:hypothetical protein
MWKIDFIRSFINNIPNIKLQTRLLLGKAFELTLPEVAAAKRAELDKFASTITIDDMYELYNPWHKKFIDTYFRWKADIYNRLQVILFAVVHKIHLDKILRAQAGKPKIYN